MDLGKAIENKKREIEQAFFMFASAVFQDERKAAYNEFQAALDSLFELIPDMAGHCEYYHKVNDCGLDCETECPYTSGERA